MPEQRKTNRIFARVPVRVRGFDEFGKPFSEDTTTLEINRDGARIGLKTAPRFGSTLEIMNLSTNLAAQVRVSHPCPQSYSGLPEWGVEFSGPAPDFWGIAFEERKEGKDLVVSALVACKVCGRREMANLSRAEYENLEQSYSLPRPCSACEKVTDWEVTTRVEEEPVPASSEGGGIGTASGAENRRNRRLTLKAPVLVTSADGKSDLAEVQDISKTGLSFSSTLELGAGDLVKTSVGHGVAETPSDESCRIVWRKPREEGGPYLYGAEFIEPE